MDDKSEPFPCGRGFLLISLENEGQFCLSRMAVKPLAILSRVYGDELARGIWRR